MSDETNSEFDPRFDPAFQRGFDTSIPVAESVPVAPEHAISQPVPETVNSEMVKPAATSATATVAAPPAPSISAKVTTVVPADESRDEDVFPVPGEDAQLFAEPLETNVARNPFLAVLLAVAVILIGGGLWLFFQTGGAFNSSEVLSQGDYQLLLATIDFAPFVALLGAATAVGLIFVLAIEWRKRH